MKRRNTALQSGNGKRRARGIVQSVRLSGPERTALRGRARAQGVSVSDYVRRLIAADEVRCISLEQHLARDRRAAVDYVKGDLGDVLRPRRRRRTVVE